MSLPQTERSVRLLTLLETAERLRRTEAQFRWMLHTGNAPKSALIGGRRMFLESEVNDFILKAFEDA